jgi:hypothetical protein
MPDLVGKRIPANIVSIIFVIIGFLLLNGFFPFSLTSNVFYDSMIFFIIGLLIFIVGKILAEPKM